MVGNFSFMFYLHFPFPCSIEHCVPSSLSCNSIHFAICSPVTQEEDYDGCADSIARALDMWASSVKQGMYPPDVDALVRYL